ncbi:oviduct-specific glycoprotein [Sclerotinia borealis F-4128]|uniref:chitinase n=1 Tax=Sclerotinia borealis (strain F-4128) TaxID=1432307 RepID=W9CXA6_SCLBF|nr:oviduct-specific glycoprotein [Sclerotinia borealis F-4128]
MAAIIQSQPTTKLLVGLFFLCLAALIHAEPDYSRHPRDISNSYSNLNVKRQNSSIGDAWRDIVFSPGHQNPAKSPAIPMPNIENTTLTFNNSVSAFNPRDVNIHSLQRRDALRCDSAPCIDGSTAGICGYGPSYCGAGNCTSYCEATAMCGEFSENADVPCGMQLCCSSSGWCGTTEAFCHNADPVHKTLPCQAGYGSCAISPSPSCDSEGNSTDGRTIGYYQSWNMRQRKCDTRSPVQLNLKGFTHLFYAFAFIDPTSFRVVPAHPDDEYYMRDFTDMSKDGSVETWIAIGGYDFSDIGPTHTTWSDMVSTKANRAAFIVSVEEYMLNYGFQGVDIDWEYPGEPLRGGRNLVDTKNLSLLVREMRAAYGNRFGISVTLAPDYWYLRWFDAKAMESSVDFFGFMAYDLHGSWDSDVLTLGKIVRGQADIREIRNNTVPLWFDGLDPKKINFGLALYGRGYTLTDPSCNSLQCSFSGPSKPAECTNSEGVMSLSEIKRLAKERNIKPNYLEESMMKELTWDDQWIGYDDEETFAAKKKVANSLCFGGTMVWSIDFQDDPYYSEPDHNGDDIEVPINPGEGSDVPIEWNPDWNPAEFGTPFTGFDKCDFEQSLHIRTAWQDVVKLAKIPAGFNLDQGWLCNGICSAGTLEKRIWGSDIASTGRRYDVGLIRKIFNNIKDLGSKTTQGQIRISCIDLPQPGGIEQTACYKIANGGLPTAYAFATSKNFDDNTIVLCPKFFTNFEHLSELVGHKQAYPSETKDTDRMAGRAHILLHELTHLAAINELYPRVVIDQIYDPWVSAGEYVYGIREVEKFALNKADRTYLNADNYAWYATTKYFESIFGTPKAENQGRGVDPDPNDPEGEPPESKPSKALNIILENKRRGVPNDNSAEDVMNWLFYSVPQGTSSTCSDDPTPVTVAPATGITQTNNPPYPAGIFDVKTQDGDCQYKNDGTGNPGAVWCGDNGHNSAAAGVTEAKAAIEEGKTLQARADVTRGLLGKMTLTFSGGARRVVVRGIVEILTQHFASNTLIQSVKIQFNVMRWMAQTLAECDREKYHKVLSDYLKLGNTESFRSPNPSSKSSLCPGQAMLRSPPKAALSFLRTLYTLPTTKLERKTSTYSQPAPKFNQLSRRISSLSRSSSASQSSPTSPSPPPIFRTHSSMSSDDLLETEESKRPGQEIRCLERRSKGISQQDPEFMRAKKLLFYYNNRDTLREKGTEALSLSQEKVDRAFTEQAKSILMERESSSGGLLRIPRG